MEGKLNQNMVEKAMEFAYEKALCGVSGLDSAYDLAADYLKGDGTLRNKANSLIRWQNAKVATSGFVTGLGGVLTIPIALPVDITCVLYVQIRMIAAIAIMGGHDPKDDRVKTMIYLCLVESSAANIAREFGIQLGKKLATVALKRLPGRILTEINKKVGFRLFTKFGGKGLINLVKLIPFLGGIIGAILDAVPTNKIGNIARDLFIPA